MDLLDRLSDLQEQVNYLEAKDSMRRDVLERALSVIAYYADCDKIEQEINPDGTVSYWKRNLMITVRSLKGFCKRKGVKIFKQRKLYPLFVLAKTKSSTLRLVS